MRPAVDPLSDLIRLLRPVATRWRRIDAGGRWALAFEARHDVLFGSVARGTCLLRLDRAPPIRLDAGDFVLVPTATAFSFASDATVRARASDDAFRGRRTTVRFGRGDAVTLHGGRFVFDTANEALLVGLLPRVIHLRAADPTVARVHALLRMNADEATGALPAADLFIARSMELVLIDVLRTAPLRAGGRGLLAGLANPVVGAALRALHRDIARAWTLPDLARRAGVSRSTLAARFSALVGTSPIRYLQRWRLAIARDELRRGVLSREQIALAVGFQSASAFSTAFRKATGLPPGRYATRPVE